MIDLKNRIHRRIEAILWFFLVWWVFIYGNWIFTPIIDEKGSVPVILFLSILAICYIFLKPNYIVSLKHLYKHNFIAFPAHWLMFWIGYVVCPISKIQIPNINWTSIHPKLILPLFFAAFAFDWISLIASLFKIKGYIDTGQ